MKIALHFLIAFMFIGTNAKDARAGLVFGLTNFLEFVSFESSSPGVVTTRPVSGLGFFGNRIDSIDVRPADGRLYGAGAAGFGSANNLFLVDLLAGSATPVGGPFDGGGTGRQITIDFNPTVDRIRVLESSNTPNNFRVNPNDGTLAATDGNVAFVPGDINVGRIPDLVAAAYTNSFAGATSTSLFAIDAGTNSLVSFVSANGGTLQTVGPLGISIDDGIGFAAFDISGETGIAYLVASDLGGTGAVANTLYSVNLLTGATTSLGVIGLSPGSTLRGIAVAVPEPSSILLLSMIAGVGVVFRRRSKGADFDKGVAIELVRQPTETLRS